MSRNCWSLYLIVIIYYTRRLVALDVKWLWTNVIPTGVRDSICISFQILAVGICCIYGKWSDQITPFGLGLHFYKSYPSFGGIILSRNHIPQGCRHAGCSALQKRRGLDEKWSDYNNEVNLSDSYPNIMPLAGTLLWNMQTSFLLLGLCFVLVCQILAAGMQGVRHYKREDMTSIC